MVKRTEYLEKLKKIKDMQIIKVITGNKGYYRR